MTKQGQVVFGSAARLDTWLATLGDTRPKAQKVHGWVRRSIESIAVLPLENRCADSTQDFFVDGMTDALIAELSRVQALRVISRMSVMRYRGTLKSAPEIATELGVDALVQGSVTIVGGLVRVQAHLIDSVSDHLVWSGNYDRPIEDVLALYSEVARAIVDDIQVQLSAAERAHLTAERQVSPEAHDFWLKGRYLQLKTVWTPQDYDQALEYFEQSALVAPEFAPAFVGQADIWHRLGGYGFRPPKEAFGVAKAAAERALELDYALPGAHAAVAFSRWLNDWDYAGAEREFRHAVALGDHDAIHQLASLLSLMGRHDEAIATYAQALTVNPFSSEVHWGLGMVYRMSGRSVEAAQSLRNWLLVEPNDVQADFQLALTLVELGQFDESIAILEGIAAIPPLRALALGALAYARGRCGRFEEAERALFDLSRLAAAGYVAHGWLAIGHMGVADHEKALDALTTAVDIHDSWIPSYLPVEPAFEPLRAHPRFVALLKLTGHSA
jgi:TolB-like protein/Flp pilus assembly protein TadD